jgi:cell division protein FtsI (penicillin-binding protein 3)
VRFDRPGAHPASAFRGEDGRRAWSDGDSRASLSRARRARLILVAVVVGAGLLALGARCAHLQVIRAPDLLDQARSQQEKEIILDPRRGPILDRNGKELALSLDVDSVFADPAEVGEASSAARRLAPLLDLKASEVRSRLESDRHFVWLKRKITPGLRQRIEALRISGIGFVRESRRYYPKQSLAAHVVGACGIDNQGQAGLEYAYNKSFKGTPGRMLFQRDGRGGRVLDRARTEPVPGAGLVLTLDEVIQHVAERELDASMSSTGASGAAVVVLRPRTGEVLALASRPTFDPNAFGSSPTEARRDRAVADFYEPGSTFKVITAAAALDTGRVRPDETIWCENGSLVVAQHRFHEDRLPFGSLTLTEVLAKSSNIGAIKIAQKVGSQDFIDVIRRFGFGRKTGLELAGESPGLLRDLPEWSGLSLASIAMGQEIGATPLQLAAALGAVANDGVWRQPYVVRETVAPDGRRVPAEPGETTLRRVIAASTARTLRRMLQSVTVEGTGRAASVPGYSVGGKTGTAQKIDASGRYARGRYVSWFAGFVPADQPALVIVVMVDEPKGAQFHGGDVAAPVFEKIAQPVLQYLGVPPDHDEILVIDHALRASLGAGDGRNPAFAARTALHAVRRTQPLSGPARIPARPGVLEASIAAIADGVMARAAARPRTDRGAAGPGDEPGAPESGPGMPDLTGMSLRQASEALAAAGLACRSAGSGPRVTRQEPAPGRPLPPGGRCTMTL